MHPLVRTLSLVVGFALVGEFRAAQAPVIDVPPTMDLQIAIQDAPEGAVLLIESRPAIEDPISISGKSLVLQAREPWIRLFGGLSISGLSAGQSVRLHGLWVLSHPSCLVLQNNQGLVWIEHCYVQGELGADAIRAESCADVVLLRTTVLGGDTYGSLGGNGLETAGDATSVHAY